MRTYIIGAALVAALALSGCGSLSNFVATGGGESVAAKGAVQFAVMNEIEQSSDRAAKGAKIIEDVKDARVMLDMQSVSLSELHTKVMQRLAEKNLEPSRMLGATLIIDAVVTHLNLKIGEGVLSAEDKVTVNAVLGWVEQAASFYVPHAP